MIEIIIGSGIVLACIVYKYRQRRIRSPMDNEIYRYPEDVPKLKYKKVNQQELYY